MVPLSKHTCIVLLLPALVGCASTVAAPSQAPTPDPVAAGGQLFEIHCAECHGPNAEGHAIPSAPALNSTEHAWHHADWQLMQFISEGKISFGPVDMPAFGDSFTPQEIEFVIAFLKSLWSEEHREFQESVNQRFVLPSATP